ncbi:hypothetical protein IQ219_04650 [Synechocystis sp. LEGE 06083]|nr:hypothetical protein [Synechocystis sp. LEGE 06083]
MQFCSILIEKPMTTITSQAIARYRDQLAHSVEAMQALDTIEDCEGNLEDAALTLGIQVGQQPDRNDWLEGLAKRCRVAICEGDFPGALKDNNISAVVSHLSDRKVCHPLLAPLVVAYVLEQGIDDFCAPIHFKLNYDGENN